jgi:hypothetical protein
MIDTEPDPDGPAWQYCRDGYDITSQPLYAEQDADEIRAWDGETCLLTVVRDSAGWRITTSDLRLPDDAHDRHFASPAQALDWFTAAGKDDTTTGSGPADQRIAPAGPPNAETTANHTAEPSGGTDVHIDADRVRARLAAQRQVTEAASQAIESGTLSSLSDEHLHTAAPTLDANTHAAVHDEITRRAQSAQVDAVRRDGDDAADGW